MKAGSEESSQIIEGSLPVELQNPDVDSRPAVSLDDLSRIESLPKDVGWMLLGGGLMSEIVMGLPPFWVLGVLIVYPKIGMPIAGLMQRKTPKLLSATLGFAHRYVDDLERRYPRRLDPNPHVSASIGPMENSNES